MQARAEARLLPDGQALDLAVPRLGPRASAAYTVDLEPATAERPGESEG
jgi:hypothetical protein